MDRRKTRNMYTLGGGVAGAVAGRTQTYADLSLPMKFVSAWVIAMTTKKTKYRYVGRGFAVGMLISGLIPKEPS